MTKKGNLVPKPIWSGEEKLSQTNYFVRVMNLQGPSLKMIFNLMNKSLKVITICQIAIQLVYFDLKLIKKAFSY